MGCCSAPYCSNTTSHNQLEKRKRAFSFPRNEERRRRWLVNCRRGAWTPGPGAFLCEVHFEESQFECRRKDGWKKLKPNAIPTLFNVPYPPQTIALTRRKCVGVTNARFADFVLNSSRGCLTKPSNSFADVSQEVKSTKKFVLSKIISNNCSCIISKSIDFPNLLNMLPSEYSYALCDMEKFPNSEYFQSRFRINISTKEAATEWLQKFMVSNENYNKYGTCVEDSQKFLYQVQMKCHYHMRPNNSRLDSKRNLKCPAELKLIVKRPSSANANKDIHLGKYPTVVLLFHVHNHPTNCAKRLKKRTLNKEMVKTFIELMKSGCTPSTKVLQYIDELRNTYKELGLLGPNQDA